MAYNVLYRFSVFILSLSSTGYNILSGYDVMAFYLLLRASHALRSVSAYVKAALRMLFFVKKGNHINSIKNNVTRDIMAASDNASKAVRETMFSPLTFITPWLKKIHNIEPIAIRIPMGLAANPFRRKP
jgi:hypothetical protein